MSANCNYFHCNTNSFLSGVIYRKVFCILENIKCAFEAFQFLTLEFCPVHIWTSTLPPQGTWLTGFLLTWSVSTLSRPWSVPEALPILPQHGYNHYGNAEKLVFNCHFWKQKLPEMELPEKFCLST